MEKDKGAAMSNDNIAEVVRLISDWAKWLIAIETSVIFLIGSLARTLPNLKLPTSKYLNIDYGRLLATLTILFFLASIASAAFLLLSLPEVVLRIQPGMNIWLAKDSAIGVSLQQLAILESMFFGVGLTCFCVLLISLIWSKQKDN